MSMTSKFLLAATLAILLFTGVVGRMPAEPPRPSRVETPARVQTPSVVEPIQDPNYVPFAYVRTRTREQLPSGLTRTIDVESAPLQGESAEAWAFRHRTSGSDLAPSTSSGRAIRTAFPDPSAAWTDVRWFGWMTSEEVELNLLLVRPATETGADFEQRRTRTESAFQRTFQPAPSAGSPSEG